MIQTEYNADSVNKFIKDNGLNVNDLSELMGVSTQAVKYWVTGQRGVPETTARLFLLFERQPELMDDF